MSSAASQRRETVGRKEAEEEEEAGGHQWVWTAGKVFILGWDLPRKALPVVCAALCSDDAAPRCSGSSLRPGMGELFHWWGYNGF